MTDSTIAPRSGADRHADASSPGSASPADVARADDYFVERNLYPNVDFYSGVILRALGIPLSMYTVMFAIGRVPGWIANWREIAFNEGTRIYRPRQIYIGPAERPWIDLEDR